jgi:hypothetical protein
VPGDEDRNLRHYTIGEADPGREERHFGEGGNDACAGLQAGATVGAVADVLAERLDAESGLLVQEKVDFVG